MRNCSLGRIVAHRRAAAGRRPDRRDDRADDQPARREPFSASSSKLLVGRVDADVRIEQKQIDAVEPLAIDLGRGREVEHRVELNRRLAALAFADDAGPGGVVKFGKVVCHSY